MNRPAQPPRQTNNAQARERLVEAIRMSPANPELPLALGNVELELGNFAGALSAFNVAVGLLPREARAHSRQALALLKLGRSVDAAHAAGRAVSLDASDVVALKVLARIHLDACQPEAAKKACRRVLRRHADDSEARQLLDEALVQEAKLAENLLEVSPKPPRFIYANAH